MERDLYDLGIFKDYPWNQADGLHSGEGSYMVQQAVVAWADDVTLLGESSDATQLLSKVKVTAETMINRLLSYGMTPNLGAGKTEAILNPRGAKATQVRRHIFNEMKCCIPLETTMEQDATLRVVPKYKHLGSYIAHGGKNRPEVQHRIAQGHQTMRDYKTKLYANPRIPLHHRIAVMKATAFAAASYNIGSMSAMTQYDEKIWHHGIVGLYRKAMAKLIPYQRLQHMTDEEVLVHAAALTPAEELRIARLRAYAQYLRRNHPFHWMILGIERNNGYGWSRARVTLSGSIDRSVDTHSIHLRTPIWIIGMTLFGMTMDDGKDYFDGYVNMLFNNEDYDKKFDEHINTFSLPCQKAECPSRRNERRPLCNITGVWFVSKVSNPIEHGQFTHSKSTNESTPTDVYRMERRVRRVVTHSLQKQGWHAISKMRKHVQPQWRRKDGGQKKCQLSAADTPKKLSQMRYLQCGKHWTSSVYRRDRDGL